MDIGGIFGGKDKKDLYWAVVLEPGWIQAGIWQITGEKAEVISISHSAAWETDQELVGAADAALSACIQSFSEEVAEPTKTVFGVPPSWVGEGQIKDEYLEKIKKICAELSLTPSGFVVLPEAISHLIKSEEGVPLNAVVLGVGKQDLEIAVFRLGGLVGVTTVGRSVSIFDDVAEGLTKFVSTEALPSRFLIYDGKEGELEDVRQALLQGDWVGSEKVKFLHTPKVEIMEPERKVLATALAGASEIANVSKIESRKTLFADGSQRENGEDIENVGKAQVAVSPSDLGFVVGEDIGTKKAEPAEMKPAEPLAGSEMPTEATSDKFSFFKKFIPLGILSSAKTKMSSILGNISFQTGAQPPPSKKVFLFAGVFFVLVLLAGLTFWWFYPKATVTIYVSPQKLEEDIDFVVDPDRESSDLENKVLTAEVLENSVSGDKTKSSTGTKTVGEEAKGTVEIRNGTPNILNLPAGTTLVAGNELGFTTDKTASVSAQVVPGSPGIANVSVTASSIGAEYNLAKDETFKVSNYLKAEVVAVSTSDFSGGSSREISAVSQEDQDSLREDLENELIERANGEFRSKVASDKFFLEDSTSSDATSVSFSHKIGDETSTLKLSLELDVSGLAVDRKSLIDLARRVLSDKVPAGFILRDEQLEFDLNLVEEKDGVFKFSGSVSANLLPEVKTEEIARQIAGKYPPLAENFLNSIPGFSRAEIRLSPRFPGRLGTLPRVIKHITIEVAAEK